MPKLTIDGTEIDVAAGTSVLQACEQLGIEVPRFCYHDKLSVPANCRMCLVEQVGAPKPIASCAMPCGENMQIKTDTDVIKKARKGVMEMLLINHPLDCPICDQGGECDLQDQAVAFGFDRGRFTEGKRAVKDKDLGPIIKTVMTRCIHCTRCIRFADEIAGVSELGMTGRGEHSEIGTYIAATIGSELSGNLVDVCPVGALTSKPYAFNARPWELKKTETIDVLDAVGSNIRMDARGNEVMRILPVLHEAINEEWLADKSRYACDGLKAQRLDTPYVRNASGKLQAVSWDEAFAAIVKGFSGVKPTEMAAIAGDLVDLESVYALKKLMTGLGTPHLECRQDGAKFDASERCGYLFNTTIAGLEQADVVLLIGTNPRWEAPLVNARLRKTWRQNGLVVASVGAPVDLTYPVQQLGAGTKTLEEILAGKHPFAETLKNAKNPVVILGMGALQREDGFAIQATVRRIAEQFNMVRDDWNGYNVLHLAAARVGALDVGFVPGKKGLSLDGILEAATEGDIKAVWLLGADEIDTAKLGTAFVVYQGHHGDAGAHRADVILPGCAYSEKSGTYVNLEGRVQTGRRAVWPVGQAKEDWKILRVAGGMLGVTGMAWQNLAELRAEMVQNHPALAQPDTTPKAEWKQFGASGKLADKPFVLPIANYYMTCSISRASLTMAQCSDEILGQSVRMAGE